MDEHRSLLVQNLLQDYLEIWHNNTSCVLFGTFGVLTVDLHTRMLAPPISSLI